MVSSLNPNRQPASSHQTSISEFRSTFPGIVIAPEDSEYHAARSVFSGSFDRHPAVIIRPRDAAEVSRVVTLARETGMDLAVRSGGHSAAGYGTCDDGIVLDLSTLCNLEIDVDGQTAWAQSGLTAGAYTVAAGKFGLATGFGDTGSVGIGGITLGGGMGYLTRKYGLTIDDLLAAEIVTADGQIHYVDADSNPDLFWAIRGGGGNFGVVTRFKFRLHEVDNVLGGMLILPATPDTIASFIALAEAAPDELSTIANVMTAPPMPFLPAEVHGKLIIMSLMVYSGDLEEGERVVAPFRALVTPLADMIRPMHYPEIYPPDDPSYHPISSGRTLFIDSVDRSTAEMILERIRSSTARMAVAQLRVLGGAMARVPVDATAYAHRGSKMMANLAALYGQREEEAVHEAWASDFASAIKQNDTGAYVNFVGLEGPERVRAAYPGSTWDRLVSLKARYDPTNLFHLNQNIPPVNQE